MYRVGQKGGLKVAVSCVLAASGRGASSHNLGSTFFGSHLAAQRTSTSDVVSSSTVIIGYYDYLGTRPKNSHRPIIVTGR